MLVMFLYIAGSDVTSILHMLVYIAGSVLVMFLYIASSGVTSILHMLVYIAGSDAGHVLVYSWL